MSNSICRAFTFINYHIPLTKECGILPQYSTIGFFDGLFTERLEMVYEKENLKPLWKYLLKRTKESKGKFSYQNIFGFSKDEWNGCNDEQFWDKETDREYPLTYVVFLQIREYMSGTDAVECQCGAFKSVLENELGEKACCYTYGTIDMNDFIVCIKSRKHTCVVEAIKKLHATGVHVVYSYSVLSINQKILGGLRRKRIQNFTKKR